MAVHAKNPSFAEEQRQRIAASVQNSSTIANNTVTNPVAPAAPVSQVSVQPNKTVTTENTDTTKKKKDIMIGIHVSKEEQTELRQMFCSNGFSLARAYSAAMTYLRQDILDGKAYISGNGEILRK